MSRPTGAKPKDSYGRASRRADLLMHAFVQGQFTGGALRNGRHALQRILLTHPALPKGVMRELHGPMGAGSQAVIRERRRAKL